MSTVDRISALQDDIICHILSFLPTKVSMATSVLARRWRFLWAHAPSLEFDSEYQRTGFNRVLLAYKMQNMNNFRLSYSMHCTEYQVETWVNIAIERNVQNLDISVSWYQFMLPQRLFTCNTLVHLSLQYCRTIPITGTAAYLPALKKLHLDRVTYESDESLPHLLSCCPVLEELFIWRIGSDMIFCHISSPTLNRLFMFHSSFWETRNKGYRLKLDTPALKYLKLEDYDNVSAGVLTSLVEANTEAYVTFNSEITLAYSRSVLEFVSRLYNVKCLYITSFGLEVPDSEFSAWTIKFDNLTELELETDCHFISRFIENADNLEVLNIDLSNNDISCWMEPKQVPACLASHLQIVIISYFGCIKEQEFNLVRYFLRNAKVLKRMEICSEYCKVGLEERHEALKRSEYLAHVSLPSVEIV
ncbi:fbd-associated F-box protein at3g52670 [Phtheirospermum japonicum]|uniref:Fbd-associated F-box protein at3g52670 n=1 Tax=Phtheirospermum japonicum TaxID=374723 RepID=A0A830D656_9LAMI|nr:fbd-associated F-box protein at3g52670 [Phtheirospermum japonicum]